MTPNVQLYSEYGEYYDQNQQIPVGTTNFYSYRSTKAKQSKGAWYFEFTHISGEKSVCASFRASNNTVGYYLHFSPNILLFNVDIPNMSSDAQLGFDQYSSTIGVGFDIKQKQISFRNHYQTVSFDFTLPDQVNQITSWEFYLFEGTNGGNDSRDDYVSINFGATDFKYPVPTGYVPWNDDLKPGCQTVRFGHFYYHAFTLILLIHK